jgi:hypothetical protein
MAARIISIWGKTCERVVKKAGGIPASNTVRSTKLPGDSRYEQDYAVARGL